MERRETQIGDKMYAILTPPVRKAMPLCTQVAVLVGPVFGTLAKDAKGGGMDAFATALQGVDPDKVDAIFMRAVQAAKLSCGKQPVFDEIDFERHFAENRSDVYHACAWTLWECVKDFFPQLHGFIQQGKEAVEKAAFQSPTDGPTNIG